MALGESGGTPYPAQVSYGSTGHRRPVKAKKGSSPAGRTRAGKGTTSYYVRPSRSGRRK